MTGWLSIDEAVGRFMIGDAVMTSLVDMPSLVDLITRALILDGHLITDRQVWREAVAPPMVAGGEITYSTADPGLYSSSIIYLYYADWVANIGQLLGIDPDDDTQEDWFEQNPCTKIITRAMMSVCIQIIESATQSYEARNGHSMMDVLFLSRKTGESLEQSAIRLVTNRQGLRTIH